MPGAYAKNSEKTARPKPNVPRRQRKPCGEAPPKPAAVRGNPPKFAAVRGNPPKRPLEANRAEYKKSGGSYDPPLAWFIFVSLLKTNISLALVI